MRFAHNLGLLLAAALFFAISAGHVETCLGLDALVEVELDPVLDQFGSQIETVQVYEDADGQRAVFGIYDTGASVISISAYDQAMFANFPEYAGEPIPIKNPGGAFAEGIGGTLTGDVSQPGTILAAGIDAVQFGADFSMTIDLSKTAFVPGDPADHGVQAFVGTETGSPYLSTITGTPIHLGRLNANPDGPSGIAAKIDMQWDHFDLGALFPEFGDLFQGVTLAMPNVEFVAPAPETRLEAADDDLSTPIVNEATSDPVRIPLAMYGEDNHADPGNMITSSWNPFQNTGVVLSHGDRTVGDDPSDRKAFLFDTGAQLSIISTAMAEALDLNLANPERTVEVQGAAGGVGSIPGFTIESLELPVDEDGNGIPEGTVRFTEVPVYVFDVTPADTDPEEGLDGILGMNLFNTAGELLYDPYDPLGPSLSATFLIDPYREALDEDLQEYLESLAGVLGEFEELTHQSYPAFAGLVGGTIRVPGPRPANSPIPEPSTLVLLAVGGLSVLAWRLRRRGA